MVLSADKGVAWVVMDRQEYIQNARALLEDTNTYRPIPSDPTTKLKNKLINIPKKIKTEVEVDDNTYKRMYPTGASAPKFYGLLKYIKRCPPETYSIQHRLYHILGCKRAVKNFKTPGW